MKWKTVKLKQKDDNYELIFGVLVIPITILLLSIAVIFIPDNLLPECHFHQATGLPCPTCGATRAFEFLLTGHFFSALSTQPLATMTITGLLLYSVYSFIVVLTGLPVIRIETTLKERNTVFIAVIILIVINWIYLVIKGI